MMKYNFGLKALILLFVLNTAAFSQRIYQWEEQGVDNYSNNPAEVPYEIIYDKGAGSSKSGSQDDQSLVKLSETLDQQSKEKLELILEAESKIEQLLVVKKSELQKLKSLKDAPREKVIELENYILKAEHNLKLIKTEKDTFIKQNQRS